MRSLSLLLLCVCFLIPASATAAPDAEWFPETGYALQGRFLAYWREHGGLPIFGFPISPPLTEVGEDGIARTVQYFERNRFELHPDNPPPYDVLLGRLGALNLAAHPDDEQYAAPTGAIPGCQYFAVTDQSVCEPFASAWNRQGGLAVVGLPLTSAQPMRSSTDGQVYLTQYFERARFELHVDALPQFQVQLGLLGSELYGDRLTPVGAHAAALQHLYSLVNGARVKAGVPPLAFSAPLVMAASTYAVIVAGGHVNHTGPDGSHPSDRLRAVGYPCALWGEDLALGLSNADAAFAAWMASPAHRRILLDPSFQDIGIGWVHRDPVTATIGDAWVVELGTMQ